MADLEHMHRDSRDYQEAKLEIALSFAPPIRPCAECGYPVAKGYVCHRCGHDGDDA